MPTAYVCEVCRATATTLDGWLIVSAQFISIDPLKQTPPGGRTLDYTAPDLVFDKLECRDAWCAKADVTPPPPPPPAGNA